MEETDEHGRVILALLTENQELIEKLLRTIHAIDQVFAERKDALRGADAAIYASKVALA